MKPEINGQKSSLSLGEIVKDFSENKGSFNIKPIGWEASQKKNGRWRIVFHYQDYQKQYEEAEWEYNLETNNVYPFEARNATQFWSGRGLTTKEDAAAPAPTQSWSVAGILYDPSRKYLVHTMRLDCGFEHSGRAVYVSDLERGESFPILASCYGGPEDAGRVLQAGGKHYLLIGEGRGESDCQLGSFWLYDLKANQFVIHAEGGIKEIKPGVFSYAYCGQESETPVPVGTVTMKNLLNRERPLRLLPRPVDPVQGLTLRKNTRVLRTQLDCSQQEPHPSADSTIIPAAGTRVLITSKCEDGSYEIYYEGFHGRVPKGSLKTTR